ncbi:hypothetical protein JCM3774_002038 [Rhodotorula dairenensis]
MSSRRTRYGPAAPAAEARQAPRVSLLSLPDELLACIFAELSPVEAIDANLCRRLRPFALARILCQIDLRSDSELYEFERLLRRSPNCGNSVRELALLFECGATRCVRLIRAVPGLTKLVLFRLKSDTLSALLLDPNSRTHLGNLRALHLFAAPDDRFLQTPRIALWGDYVASWPSLEELHLYAAPGMQILPQPKSRLMPFRTLKRLHLRLTAFDARDVLDFDRVFPALEDLVIEETEHPRARFRSILLRLDPTRLRRLDLRPAAAAEGTDPARLDPLNGGSVIDDLLPKFTRLETMYFAPGLYHPASLLHVLPRLARLRHVEFSRGTRVTPELLDALVSLPAVQTVVLNHALEAVWGTEVDPEAPPSRNEAGPFHMWPDWKQPRWDHTAGDLLKALLRAKERGITWTGTAVEAMAWWVDFVEDATFAILISACPRCPTRLREYLARQGLDPHFPGNHERLWVR